MMLVSDCEVVSALISSSGDGRLLLVTGNEGGMPNNRWDVDRLFDPTVSLMNLTATRILNYSVIFGCSLCSF